MTSQNSNVKIVRFMLRVHCGGHNNLMFAIPKCIKKTHTHTYIYTYTHTHTKLCISQTQQNFIMFIIVLGQHVSILIESSSSPSKIQILT